MNPSVPRFLRLAALSLVLAAGRLLSAAPPVNDNCEGAVLIPRSLPTTVTVDLAEATTEAFDPRPSACTKDPGLGFARTVWFSFQAPQAATYVFDTAGSTAGLDTAIQVLRGTCDISGPVPTGCADDFGTERRGKLSIVLAANARVLLVAGVLGRRDPANPDTVLPSPSGRLAITVTQVDTLYPFELIVPSVAHAPGLRGATFVSDLSVRARDETRFYLKFLGHDADGTGGPETAKGEAAYRLPPGGAMDLDDVLGRVFGLDNDYGGLVLRADKPVHAGARTYNDALEGSFGQFVDGLDPELAGLATDAQGFLSPVRHDLSYRTNAVFTNASAREARLLLQLVDAAGSPLAPNRVITIAPWATHQLTRVVEELRGLTFTEPVRAATILVTNQSEGATRVLGLLTTIDNRTNDPYSIPMRR